MSRGNRGFLSGLALLGLSLLLLGGPAGAQLVTSGAAAGEDNIAPEPVGAVTVDTMVVGSIQAIEVSWTLSPSDFVRQQPTGSDATSGGTFANANDVAQYVVTRITLTPADTTEVGTVEAGAASLVDSSLVGITGSVKYTVVAADAAGNESAATSSAEISLAPAGEATVGVQGDTLVVQGQLVLDMVLPVGTFALDQLEEAIRAALAELAGVPLSRVTIISIRSGSVVVVYEITGADAATVIAGINADLAANPDALSDIDSDLGTVTQASTAQGASPDLGQVGPNATATRTITIGNDSSDPESVVAGSVGVSGAGFTASPTSFAVPQGESVTITLTFSAAAVGNINGTYTGVAAIATNDTANALTLVSMTATVAGGTDAPALSIEPAGINFGTTEVDSTETMTLTLTNTGGADLTGTISLAGDAEFDISESTFSLSADEALEVEVTFTPSDTVDYTAAITIASNDRVRPTATVNVLGTGVPAGFAPALPGDFDNNGTVDFDDFFLFADQFGTTTSSANWDPLFDMQPDGEINFDDFFLFADAFGTSL